jgi:hypothetical protein
MTHAFMYPRVTQIAPRAHSVPASSLGTHLLAGASAVLSGPTASGAPMTVAPEVRAPGLRA